MRVKVSIEIEKNFRKKNKFRTNSNWSNKKHS